MNGNFYLGPKFGHLNTIKWVTNFRIVTVTHVTRVNSTNVLDEGLRIGGKGRRMNSKVKISQTRCISRISVVLNLAQSQSVPGRPLVTPIYR
jgi:hypothetical protein